MTDTDLAGVTERAVMDAIMYGTGVVVVRNSPTAGLEFMHVPISQYAELAQSLQWAAQNVEGKMQ